ncbi:tetratricopeptide repeat protein [Spirochaetota bacterium]
MAINKNNEPDFNLGDEDIDLKKNRISSIEAERGRKKIRTTTDNKKPIIIASSIAVAAILVTVILIKFVYKKPWSFTPSNTSKVEDNKTDVVSGIIQKDIKDTSENIHIIKGRESYSKGFLNDAITEFNEVLQSGASDKDKAIALNYLGMISDDRGNYDKAIEYYSKSLLYDKENADTYRNLALSFRHKKDYERAIENAVKSLSIKPNDLNSMILLGNLYYETKKYKDAVKQYGDALKLTPENPSLLYNMGAAVFKTGDEFSAAEYFKRAATADRVGKVAHRAYSRLGVMYTERGSFDLAEKYLKQALLIRPKDPINRYNLGIIYLKLNKKEKALQELTLAEKYGQKDVAMLENIGHAHFSLKNYDQSLNLYNKILKTNKRNIKILSRIAEIYYEKGELDRALELFRKITAIEPTTENARVAYLNMGNILDDAQRFTEAIEAYKKAITLSNKDDSAYYNLGIAYKHAKMPELAMLAWKKASQLNPKNPKPLLARANYFYEKREFDLAEKEFRMIITRWPNNQEGHFKIATIYYKRGQFEFAQKAYNRVLQIKGNSELSRKSLINLAVLNSKVKKDEKSLDESLRLIQKALLLKPGDADALFSLGLIYAGKDMQDKAIDTFYQVLKATNNSKLISKTYNNIGRSYYKLKKYKKSLQAFTRGVEEDPSNEEIRMNRKAAMQAYETELARD